MHIFVSNRIHLNNRSCRPKMKSFIWLLVLLYCATVYACRTNLPFSPSIVGKNHRQIKPCMGRFNVRSLVSVTNTEIRYSDFHGYPSLVCGARYTYRISRWGPMLTEYPGMPLPESEQFTNYCEREQERQKKISWPQGATKTDFIAGVKKTIDGLTWLRDHHCYTPENPPGPPLPYLRKQEYVNAWLDAPITYLYSVAFNHGLCLHI